MPFSSTNKNGQQQSALKKAVMQQKPFKAKVVVLGNTGVGKTSILLRHDGQGFISKMSSTLGASYICSKSKVLNGREFELQIWDTAGQERFRSMVPLYLRNTAAAVLVFDVTNRQSFRDLDEWIKAFSDVVEVEQKHTDESPKLLLFVVANKCDLVEMRVVNEEEGRQFAEQRNAQYFETSALSGRGIETAMSTIADYIMEEEQRILKECPLANSSFNLANSESNSETGESEEKNGKKKGNNAGGCCAIL